GPAPPARSEDEELDLTLSAMLSSIGLGPEQLQQAGAAAPQAPATAPPETAAATAAAATGAAAEGPAAAAAAAATPAGAPEPSAAAAPAPRTEGTGPSAMTSLMGVTATVEGAVSIMARSPAAATAFSMGDLLFTLAVREKEEGHEGGTVVGELLR
ncbi:hypothetical protein DUNSADRAFT_14408, partial [Dunaliella salina]